MKSTGNIVSFFVLIIVSTSLVFYLYQRHSNASKVSPSNLQREAGTDTTAKNDVTGVHVQGHAETSTPPITKAKKGCACCRDTLTEIKAIRKVMEKWAIEMIDTHGYEEGIKRVTAHSPILAKRVRGLLEKKKKSTNPGHVQR